MIKNGYDVPGDAKSLSRDGDGTMHWYAYMPVFSASHGAFVKIGPHGRLWGRAEKAKIGKVRTHD